MKLKKVLLPFSLCLLIICGIFTNANAHIFYFLHDYDALKIAPMGTRLSRTHDKTDDLSTGTAVLYTYGNEVDNVTFHYKSNGNELCSFTVREGSRGEAYYKTNVSIGPKLDVIRYSTNFNLGEYTVTGYYLY